MQKHHHEQHTCEQEDGDLSPAPSLGYPPICSCDKLEFAMLYMMRHLTLLLSAFFVYGYCETLKHSHNRYVRYGELARDQYLGPRGPDKNAVTVFCLFVS